MQASLRWLDELGWKNIHPRIHALAAQCRAMLAELPSCILLTPLEHAGLIAFNLEGVDPHAAALELFEQGIVIRSVYNPNCLRVSTGFYNTEDDLARLRAALLKLR
jgi:L-cysteine/cystine lyase